MPSPQAWIPDLQFQEQTSSWVGWSSLTGCALSLHCNQELY